MFVPGGDDLVDAVEHVVGRASTSAAPSWDSSCSIVRGPMIAAVTAGWWSTNASARCDQRDARPRRRAAPSASAASSLRWFSGSRQVVAARAAVAARRDVGAVGALAVLARQPAAGERAPRDHAHAVALRTSAARRPRCRARGSSTAAARTRTARGRARSADPLRLDDLRRRERRASRGSGPCPARTRSVSAPSVSSMSVSGVGPVDLVQVDVVGAEAAQAVLDLADDPAARVAALVRVVAHRAVDLRGEHDVVAPAAASALPTISSDSPAE